jgi:hypothetical protein
MHNFDASSQNPSYISNDLTRRILNFMEKTKEHSLHGPNPGGYYAGIWCRDASYILKDWTLSGKIGDVLKQIVIIWSHQIGSGEFSAEAKDDDTIICGRGSPELNFKPKVVDNFFKSKFRGSLPTSFYHEQGLCEVFGKNPDIDSTALMVSSTSWILSLLILSLKEEQQKETFVNNNHLSLFTLSRDLKLPISSSLGSEIQKVVQFVTPKMHYALDYLVSRDTDKDGLLEQNHNEDWMDSIMRVGKIVYSQACWILALKNFSVFLGILESIKNSDHHENSDYEYIRKMTDLASQTIDGVESELWSEEDGCYIDIQETHHIGGPYRTLTQDVSLYLIALTENTYRDNLFFIDLFQGQDGIINNNNLYPHSKKLSDEEAYNRASSTLNAIRNRIWKEKWPLVTEVELKTTGPWILKPYEYHNHTFWPWMTGIEMLARSRFKQFDDCRILLCKLGSEHHPHIHTFYEWLNPLTDSGQGAYPFRTGISAVRISLRNLLNATSQIHNSNPDE